METNTAAEPLASTGPFKTISDLPSWPPRMTWSFGHAVSIGLADTILDVEWVMPGDGLIGLRLAKADAQEYGVELSIPTDALKDMREAIRPGMKLSAVGRLELAESFVQALQKTPAGNSHGI
jgi:hypothetical protein